MAHAASFQSYSFCDFLFCITMVQCWLNRFKTISQLKNDQHTKTFEHSNFSGITNAVAYTSTELASKISNGLLKIGNENFTGWGEGSSNLPSI